jgi:ParB family chromosome partitioning protein
VAADDAARAEILAVCVASSVTAVQKATDRGDALRDSRRRLDSARHIAGIVGLDMAKWWRPTAATYLGSVSKDTILDALAAAGQVKPGGKLGAAKKADLAALAEERLGPTTWLPAFLRTGAVEVAQPADDETPAGPVGGDQPLAAE